MQRLLAIDCSERELCFVIATAAGDRITVESAEAVELPRPADNSVLSNEDVGKALQGALGKYKRSGAKVLVGVDRSAVELFELTLPPASDAELPELVINQVTSQSAGAAEGAVIDFVPHPGAVTEPRQITAAALASQELTRINAVCSAASVTPDRLLVRPYETASLFLKHNPLESGFALLVNVIDDDVDLIVVDSQRPLFFRSVRLPGKLGNESAETRLVHEIRRTLLVAPPEGSAARTIDTIYLLGTSSDYERVRERVSQGATTNVELYDPLSGFLPGKDWKPLTSGRLVPLLGMLVNEAKGGTHAIDFLHPRRPPKAKNQLQRYAVLGTVVGLMLAVAGYYQWDLIASADAENHRLQEELSDLEKLVKKTTEKKKVIAALDEWNTNSIVWLDELRDLSSRFPSGQDIVLQRLTMSPARGGKANVAFQGLVREPGVVTRMEATLRDARHEIQTPRVDERVQDKSYTWNFESLLSLSAVKPKSTAEPDDDAPKGTGKSSRKNGAGKKTETRKSANPKSPAPESDGGAETTGPAAPAEATNNKKSAKRENAPETSPAGASEGRKS
ncbi:hypothetical protein [Schlesneria sp.]|uniref:hypothetical protein n=1 Tax=Schlesneria sp. TaxID=2762018 RepID=UPI002EE174DD